MNKRVGLAAFGAAAAAAALGSAANGGAAETGCTAGLTTFGGTNARVFCGPATATVHAGGKTFTIRQGSCMKGAKYLSVNIGEIVLGTANKPKPDYFGLDVGQVPLAGGSPAPKDGTYHSGIIALDHAGKGYALRAQATVKLTNNRSRGSFIGTLLTGGTITGTFSC